MNYQQRLDNHLRAQWYARGEYYAWSARRAFTGRTLPPERDPLTGRAWQVTYPPSIPIRALAFAAYAGMARAAFAHARLYPVPLP